MARVTVEDCLKHVKNRFELVVVAAKRARQLMRGKEPTVAWDNDKPTVVALREIAAGHTNFNVDEEAEQVRQISPPLQEASSLGTKLDEEPKPEVNQVSDDSKSASGDDQ